MKLNVSLCTVAFLCTISLFAQAPGAVVLSSASTTEATTDLSWTLPTGTVTHYDVYQDAVLIGDDVTDLFFNVTGLSPETSYDFTVFAFNLTESSPVSNTETVVTLEDTTAPANITDLDSNSTDEASTTLTWSEPFDLAGVTSYEIFQDAVSIGTTALLTYDVSGLSPETSYDFIVRASDIAGNTSGDSNTETVLTLADTTPPANITDLDSNSTDETSTTLTWSEPFDLVGVTSYEIFQDAVSIGTTTLLTYDVSGLSPETSYDFIVRASDNAGNTSGDSNTATVLTLADTTPPDAPDDLTSSNVTFSTADLSWSPVSDNVGVVDYQVYQDEVPIAFTGGFSSYNVTGLTELTIYQFKVTALDAAGNESELSNVEIVETPKESGAIPYTNLNSNLFSVDWVAKDITAAGNVGIGTLPNAGYKLAVAGNVVAEEVRVALEANWPDYVFKSDYELPSLTEVEKFIETYGHLKDIPSASEAELNGISLGEMNSRLLRKIEELTLYIIEQEKKIEALSLENAELEALNSRITEVERLLNELKK